MYASSEWAKKSLEARSRGDFEESLSCLLKGMEEDEAECFMRYGDCFRLGGLGICKDEAKAFVYTQKAADKGFPPALCVLSRMYKDGTGIAEKDSEKESHYSRLALESGDPYAAGYVYDYGLGVQPNKQLCVQFYQEAADKGNDLAFCNLGLQYYMGSGVQRDLEKAAQLWKKGADLRFAISERNYGLCVLHGEGVEKNDKEAFEYAFRASQQKYSKAQDDVGRSFLFGRGTERHLMKAYTYLKAAQAQGVVNSRVLMKDSAFAKIEQCFLVQKSCLTLIMIRKYRVQCLDLLWSSLPMEMVVCIAKQLWETRYEDIWKQEEEEEEEQEEEQDAKAKK